MCLNSFVSGLRDPLGASIRAMKPQTLAEALDFCIKEQNIYYQRGYSRKYPNKYQYGQNNTPYTGNRYQTPQPDNGTNYNNTQFRQNNFVPSANTPKFSRNSNYNGNFQRYSHDNNSLASVQNRKPLDSNTQIPKLPPPEKMDTSSGFSSFKRGNPFSGHFKSSPSTQISRRSNMEVNNIQEDEDYEISNIEEINFQGNASYNQLDTQILVNMGMS